MLMETSSANERLSEPRAARPECDDLGDGDEVGVATGAIAVHGLDRGAACEVDVAGTDAEEHRRQEGDDEGDQDAGGLGWNFVGGLRWFAGDGGFGHARGPGLVRPASTLGCSRLSRKYFSADSYRGEALEHPARTAAIA
jgi:hypothetical protein